MAPAQPVKVSVRRDDVTKYNFIDFRCRCGRDHLVELLNVYPLRIDFATEDGGGPRYICNRCGAVFELQGDYAAYAEVRPNRNFSCNPANEEFCVLV